MRHDILRGQGIVRVRLQRLGPILRLKSSSHESPNAALGMVIIVVVDKSAIIWAEAQKRAE